MDNNNHKKKGIHNWILVLIGIICIVTTFVLLIIFLLQGNTTISDEGGDVDITESITCSSDDFTYPFFKHNEANGSSIKINAIFDDSKLDTISLTYKLEYDEEEQAKQVSAINHASLNGHFKDDSLGADALGAHYSVTKGTMQLNLHAEASDITGITSKYFMIDNTSGNHSKDTLIKMFNNKGLNCIINQ